MNLQSTKSDSTTAVIPTSPVRTVRCESMGEANPQKHPAQPAQYTAEELAKVKEQAADLGRGQCVATISEAM